MFSFVLLTFTRKVIVFEVLEVPLSLAGAFLVAADGLGEGVVGEVVAPHAFDGAVLADRCRWRPVSIHPAHLRTLDHWRAMKKDKSGIQTSA